MLHRTLARRVFWLLTLVSAFVVLKADMSTGGRPVARPTWIAASLNHASGASTNYLTLFNASGSGKVIRVTGIYGSPANTAAVTGVSATFTVSRVSTAGTTCTSITPQPFNSTNAALPAQITASRDCTTDPTVAFDYITCAIDSDETGAKATQVCYEYSYGDAQPITLNVGEGIMLKTNALAPAGIVSVWIIFCPV